jgi:hypothetical protein
MMRRQILYSTCVIVSGLMLGCASDDAFKPGPPVTAGTASHQDWARGSNGAPGSSPNGQAVRPDTDRQINDAAVLNGR